MSNLIEQANSHAWAVVKSISKNSSNAKIKANIVRDVVKDAYVLGALSAAERVLYTFQSSHDILNIKDPQEMKDLFLGELHIFVKDLQHYMADTIGKPQLKVSIDDLIRKNNASLSSQ